MNIVQRTSGDSPPQNPILCWTNVQNLYVKANIFTTEHV